MKEEKRPRDRLIVIQEERIRMMDDQGRSAERPQDYFEFTSPAPVQKTVAKSVTLRKGETGPPKRLSIMKWVVIGALALGAVALVMKPRKAY